jgi:NAD(P)H-dependent FMN reductase
MNILALCGSLRAASINAALLRAARRVAPPGIDVQLGASLGDLPLFNPDLEAALPLAVQALHEAVGRADALVIASPEYAHGVTGTIKNALDWLVGFPPFAGKPVAVFNASARAHHADDALRETLRTMSAAIVAPACLTLPLLGAKLDEDGMVASAEVSRGVRDALVALRDAVAMAAGTGTGTEPGAASFPLS